MSSTTNTNKFHIWWHSEYINIWVFGKWNLFANMPNFAKFSAYIHNLFVQDIYMFDLPMVNKYDKRTDLIWHYKVTEMTLVEIDMKFDLSILVRICELYYMEKC